MKQQALGICDNCLSEIPRGEWYTSKGKPRLYCGRDCRNTGNSRAGSPIRSAKAKRRVARGEWQNPHHLNPPTPAEQSRRARLGRRREVKAGTWRNPALSDEAREKLSRPRKHEPALHAVLEKLQQGQRVADLSPEEKAIHRAYQKSLRQARRDEINARYRNRYRQRQASLSNEEREVQRAKWREQNRRRAIKKENRMPKISKQVGTEIENRIIALLGEKPGLTEPEIATILDTHPRTVNNYLRKLEKRFAVTKTGKQWYAAAVGDATSLVEPVTQEDVKLADIVRKMVTDSIALETALDYVSLSGKRYDQIVAWQKIDATINIFKLERGFAIYFAQHSRLIIRAQGESGISKHNLRHRILSDIFPQAVRIGVDDAIRLWLQKEVAEILNTVP